MEYILINGKSWAVRTMAITENVDKVRSSFSGEAMDGSTLLDYVGTKIGHTVEFDLDGLSRAEIDELYTLAIAPSNQGVEVTLPHLQSTLTYMADIDIRARKVIRINKEAQTTDWGTIEMTFEPLNYTLTGG